MYIGVNASGEANAATRRYRPASNRPISAMCRSSVPQQPRAQDAHVGRRHRRPRARADRLGRVEVAEPVELVRVAGGGVREQADDSADGARRCAERSVGDAGCTQSRMYAVGGGSVPSSIESTARRGRAVEQLPRRPDDEADQVGKPVAPIACGEPDRLGQRGQRGADEQVDAGVRASASACVAW